MDVDVPSSGPELTPSSLAAAAAAAAAATTAPLPVPLPTGAHPSTPAAPAPASSPFAGAAGSAGDSVVGGAVGGGAGAGAGAGGAGAGAGADGSMPPPSMSAMKRERSAASVDFFGSGRFGRASSATTMASDCTPTESQSVWLTLENLDPSLPPGARWSYTSIKGTFPVAAVGVKATQFEYGRRYLGTGVEVDFVPIQGPLAAHLSQAEPQWEIVFGQDAATGMRGFWLRVLPTNTAPTIICKAGHSMAAAVQLTPGVQYQLSKGDKFWISTDWIITVHDMSFLGASEAPLAAALRDIAGDEEM